MRYLAIGASQASPDVVILPHLPSFLVWQLCIRCCIREHICNMIVPVLSRTARRRTVPRLSCSLSSSPSSHIRSRIAPIISHQRRNSSSKPSSPPNGDSPQVPAAPTDAPVKETAPSSRKRSWSRSGRTKSREGSSKAALTAAADAQAFAGLPSVPSTHHLHRQGMLRV